MRARLRTLVATTLAALTVVALTACAAIPTGGGVRTGQSVKDEAISGFELRPDRPVAGADQTAILRGFVAAGTGAQDDYGTAREFLAKGFAEKWNPRRGVTVLQGSGAIERVADRELTYTLTASATVDADGEYTQAVRPTTSTLTFQFVREDGEWRIAYAPDGIILTPSASSRSSSSTRSTSSTRRTGTWCRTSGGSSPGRPRARASRARCSPDRPTGSRARWSRPSPRARSSRSTR